jgi:hypothetical protein
MAYATKKESKLLEKQMGVNETASIRPIDSVL